MPRAPRAPSRSATAVITHFFATADAVRALAAGKMVPLMRRCYEEDEDDLALRRFRRLQRAAHCSLYATPLSPVLTARDDYAAIMSF